MRSVRCLVCASAAAAAAVFAAPLHAATLTVSGTANIFAAGEASTTGHDPDGGGPGTLPPFFTFLAGTGLTLTFQSVTGMVDCCSNDPTPDIGPDGQAGGTNVAAFSGVSGIVAPTQLFLVGLFTDGTNFDGAAPATLNFNTIGTSFTSLSPALWQQFWVGDGRTGTGSGSTQVFNVPVGATTLYLGFTDASGFGGPPGFYNDNTGALTATFTITAPSSPVSEPASLLLLGSGLAGVAARARRRRPE